MAQVNTVRGPVDGDRLGRTLMHEHIFVLSPEIEKTAGEWDEAAEQARAVAKLRDLKDHGIDTLVDLTVIGLGRYIPRVAAIADQVPEINVVVATGVYTYNEVPMFFHFQGPGTILGGPEPMVDIFLPRNHGRASARPGCGPASSSARRTAPASRPASNACSGRWRRRTGPPACPSPRTRRHRPSPGDSSSSASSRRRAST